MIAENLKSVLENIHETTVKAGREPGSVKLIAVSKTKPIEQVGEAFRAGQVNFGENRVQELQEKQPQLPEAKWHMIGGLQRNKVKYIVPFVHLIHSVDSVRLLEEIEKRASKIDRVQDVLLQLNISDESQKGGFTKETASELLKTELKDFPHVRVRGLMGMAAFVDDESVIRSQFRSLREASESFKGYENERIQMKELSMGMSGDYPIAIEEGATLVRIGSAIFGHR